MQMLDYGFVDPPAEPENCMLPADNPTLPELPIQPRSVAVTAEFSKATQIYIILVMLWASGGIAFGWSLNPIPLLLAVIEWPFVDQHYKIIAFVVFAGIAITVINELMEFFKRVELNTGNGKNNIFGDARAAYDWEVDRALQERNGGFAPMFED